MNDQQWRLLKDVVEGRTFESMPVGFIIDSPWLPGWYGVKILDYLSDSDVWLTANLKAIQYFPEVMFLPGFWSEFGMCTEPSAFGARCVFPVDEFPHAYPLPGGPGVIDGLEIPDPRNDGLLPLVLNRLKRAQPRIEAAGHRIRFAVSRGPLNIASYLVGMTEFLTLLLTEPERAEVLIRKITAFVKQWLHLQREAFPSIDGVMLLDDIIGFLGEVEFRRFGLPCFTELFATDVSIKFLHNDASCVVSAPFLPEMGVNLFNMGFDIPLKELQHLTGGKVTLLGNLPPRDVLANGTPEEIGRGTRELIASLTDRSRVVLSCGGGMPPGVSTENIRAFLSAVKASGGKAL
jgi:uroporphyrinogen-III decarboxylase